MDCYTQGAKPLEEAGYTTSFEEIRKHGFLFEPFESFDNVLGDIEMDEKKSCGSAAFRMRLDLGGFAKGWAAQQAMNPACAMLLQSWWDAGGDIAISGP